MRRAVCLTSRADVGMGHIKEGVLDLDKDMDKDKLMEEPSQARSKEQGLLY